MFNLRKILKVLEIIALISTKTLEEITKMAPTLSQIKVALDTLVADVQIAIQDIETLNEQLATAIAAEADPAELQAISDEIAAATTSLAAVLPAPVNPV